MVQYICDKLYHKAETITLVMDNPASHSAAALNKTFKTTKAKRFWDRLEQIFTPKHVNWLNIAEIELEILTKQCFNRRIDKINTVKAEVRAWQNHINNKNTKIKWQFSSFEARIKLHRLYLSIDV